MGVANYRLRYAPHQRSPHPAPTSTSHHYQVGAELLGPHHYLLVSLPAPHVRLRHICSRAFHSLDLGLQQGTRAPVEVLLGDARRQGDQVPADGGAVEYPPCVCHVQLGAGSLDQLRRRLGGFRRGAEAGYRDVEAEISEHTGQHQVPAQGAAGTAQAEEATGGTVEEASS